MARLTKVYYSAFHKPSPKRVTLDDTEKRTFSIDWSGGLEGSTVSGTPDWATDDTAIVTLSSEAVASGVSTCLIEALEVGAAKVSCTAILADGRKLVQWFRVAVNDKDAVR